MDFLRRTLDQIRDLIRRMSFSQRWSTGLALLAILVALGLLVLWTGRAEFVPLLVGAPPDVVYRVKENLAGKSIPFRLENNVLSVPVDAKDRIEIDLVGEGVFPEGQDVFSWVYDPDITETKGKREMKYLRSLTRRLQVMIESLAPVRSARVEITPAPQSPFLVQSEPGKAAVTLQLRSGQKLKKETALAIARTVAAADRSLKPADVTIVDTEGNHYRIPREDDLAAISGDQLEIKRSWEEYYRGKAEDALGWLAKKIVTVDVTLDFQTLHEQSRVFDPEKTVVVEEETRTRDSQGFPLANVPGAESNLGLSTLPLVTASGDKIGPATDTTSDSRSRSEASSTVIDRSKPAGEAKEIAIAVIVDKEEVALRGSTAEKLQEALALLVPGRDLKKVTVTPVSFAPPPEIPAPTLLDRSEELWRRYGDQAMLVLLIAAAAIMVSWILRRAVPRDVTAQLEQARRRLQEEEGGTAPIEDEPATPAGQEHTDHIRRKLKTIVKDNPRTAANLIRRWVAGQSD